MKKFTEILICCLFALGIGAGCNTDPGTPPAATPVPTAEPVPTEVPVPTPVVIQPCVLHSSMGAENVYKGDCAESDTCRDGHDTFFYGKSCKTKEAM